MKSLLIGAGIVTVVALAVVVALVTATHHTPEDEEPAKLTSTVSYEIEAAVVFNVGTGQNGVAGTLFLSQKTGNDDVLIKGNMTGLLPNTVHGFHVHESGDIRNGCASTGSHFNPGKKEHGDKGDLTGRHVGDLGNVESDGSGVANIEITDSVISLSGPNSIIGRAFVVHEKVDDLGKGGHKDSKTTGNAGSRLGCGIVGILYKPKA